MASLKEKFADLFVSTEEKFADLFVFGSRYICYRKRSVPYMLAHIAIQRRAYIFSANQIRLHCVRHLTCERAWFGLVLFRCLYCVCHFGFKNILIYPELAVLFSPYSTCEVIPKLWCWYRGGVGTVAPAVRVQGGCWYSCPCCSPRCTCTGLL
jgi:hypothetical protein